MIAKFKKIIRFYLAKIGLHLINEQFAFCEVKLYIHSVTGGVCHFVITDMKNKQIKDLGSHYFDPDNISKISGMYLKSIIIDDTK